MDSQRKGTSPLFYTPFDPSSFSNDERHNGLSFIMRQCDLLDGEPVYDKRRLLDMEDDVTIVIFPDKGSVF